MTRLKTAQFRQLAWRGGVPEGIGAIDAETSSHLQASYRVVRRGGKVVEVRRENGVGLLQENSEGYARWSVYRDQDERGIKIEVFDGTDRLVREDQLKQLSAHKLIETSWRDTVPLGQDATRDLFVDPLNAGTQARKGKTDISRYELTLDESSRFVIERLYQNPYGTRQRDAQGSFGQRFLYSREGLKLRQ